MGLQAKTKGKEPKIGSNAQTQCMSADFTLWTAKVASVVQKVTTDPNQPAKKITPQFTCS